jgi:hypothetical protein
MPTGKASRRRRETFESGNYILGSGFSTDLHTWLPAAQELELSSPGRHFSVGFAIPVNT